MRRQHQEGMLQGLLSPASMELLTGIDNNLAASNVWSFANQPDANYEAAAMEAILSQASLGLISENQSLVSYGMLNHPPIIEGMDETQCLPQSSCPHPGLSSSSATTASSALGLDQKPPNTRNKHSPKPGTIMSFSYDLATGQAGMCDASAAKRRSWQEALSSPLQTDNYNLSIENHHEREISLLAPSILYSVNDPKVSIASLAYPCTIVETTHESGYPSYIDNTSMCMSTHNIDPLINPRANLMQERMIASAGMCADDDHGACMGHTVSKDDMIQMRGCAKWKEGIKASAHPRKSSDEGHDQIKDGLSITYEYVNLTHGSSFQGIRSDDNSAHLRIYKEEPYHDDGKEKDIAGIALSSRQPIPLANHQSRKRPAAIVHLPSLSSSYSKRAHLQSKQMAGGACSTTTTTTSSTTTRSSKSSSRNPQGPALNTNGKPRAMQGCANDPQSVAARNRRERINARLKVLQELVPNGSKVDLVTMLEKAINYVKFLQLQLRVLSNDDFWQANQDNGEQVTTSLKEDYNTNLNVPCESMVACSDNIGRNHCNYV